jgi:tRNA(fMet)-specific endonuclease VapC
MTNMITKSNRTQANYDVLVQDTYFRPPTNICIYFLKGMYTPLKEKLFNLNPNKIKIASIVKAELLYGAEKSQQRKENIEKIEQFLFPFEIISFDDKSSQYYAIIRSELEKKGTIIGPNDMIIAATVLANDGIIITNNEKEFKRLKNLKMENWIK